jgi:hypothetical protein
MPRDPFPEPGEGYRPRRTPRNGRAVPTERNPDPDLAFAELTSFNERHARKGKYNRLMTAIGYVAGFLAAAAVVLLLIVTILLLAWVASGVWHAL